MVNHDLYLEGMVITIKRSSLRYKICKYTASNYKLNKKVLKLKRSWDEVESILNSAVNKKKKKK